MAGTFTLHGDERRRGGEALITGILDSNTGNVYYSCLEVFRMAWKPGDTFLVNVNQGDREAMVLAVIGNKALIEYVMPAGSTALQIISAGDEQRGKSVSYPSVPTKWLRAIVEEGREWEGNPQRGRKVPSAETMLYQRTGRPPAPLPVVHQVGCICGECSAAYVRDAWDPRMGER